MNYRLLFQEWFRRVNEFGVRCGPPVPAPAGAVCEEARPAPAGLARLQHPADPTLEAEVRLRWLAPTGD